MSNTFDEEAFVREITHAQMMHRDHYKQECARRHADMKWNEAQANEALVAGIKQDRIDEQHYQVKLANAAVQESKQDANDQFWSRVFFVGTGALVLIVLAFLYQIMKG